MRGATAAVAGVALALALACGVKAPPRPPLPPASGPADAANPLPPDGGTAEPPWPDAGFPGTRP